MTKAVGETVVATKEEANGFIIEENRDEGKKYLVSHPIYDGAYEVYASDVKEDAIRWCNEQNFDSWTADLL